MSVNKDKVFPEYNFPARIPGSEDKWQRRTYTVMEGFIGKYLAPFVNENSLILNIASAGNSYGLPEKNMQHFDMTNESIAYLPNAQTRSIENILYSDEIYDIIICTGNILNDEDPMKAFEEFHRVLRPNGFLVIEFENSNTLELLFKKSFNKKAVFVNPSCYGKQQTWYYSDNWINEILGLNRFEIVKKRKFHYFFPRMTRFADDEKKEDRSFKFDSVFRLVPFVRNLASNTIILCQKKTD